MLEQYPESVKVVFKNYPIASIHKFAATAAVAAMAAGKQGKFWEFHDELFKDFDNLNEEKLTEIAVKLGLDAKAFEADRNGRDLADHLTRDYQEGNRLGIRGVPTVFVNGKIQRRWSFELLAMAIEEELKPAKGVSK